MLEAGDHAFLEDEAKNPVVHVGEADWPVILWIARIAWFWNCSDGAVMEPFGHCVHMEHCREEFCQGRGHPVFELSIMLNFESIVTWAGLSHAPKCFQYFLWLDYCRVITVLREYLSLFWRDEVKELLLVGQ